MSKPTKTEFPVGVTFIVSTIPEDVSVRGNAVGSGDDAEDAAVENGILADLEAGNEWAWCIVEVAARVDFEGTPFCGRSYLGGCSYKNEAAFMQETAYLEDLREEAYVALLQDIADAVVAGSVAARAMAALKGSKNG